MSRDHVASRVGILFAAAIATAAWGRPPADQPTPPQLTEQARVMVALDAHERTVISARLAGDVGVTLRLERFRVTSERTRFIVARGAGNDRDVAFDPDRVVLLRGTVEGHPRSHVFLAVEPGRISGRIEMGPGLPTHHVVTRTAADGGVLDLTGASAPPVPINLDVPSCGVVEDEGVDFGTPRGLSGGDLAAKPVRLVELAVEADYEYYQLTEDIDASLAYLVRLYGAVADIYIRDARANFLLTFVRVNEEPSGFFDAEVPLNGFRLFWEENMTGVERDLAQLVSGRRDLREGGRASGIGTTCSDRAYSYFGYTLGDFPPDLDMTGPFVRDVTVAAHELGHVMGGPHTHCLGIDTCNAAGASPSRGPIMSYCGQSYTGGDANTDARLHRIVSGLIDAEITSECIAFDCNLNALDDADEIAQGLLTDSDGDGIADEHQDCNGNGVIDRADIEADRELDRNLNGVIDSCEPDCDGDLLPDDYTDDTDLNGNFVLDTCEADLDDSGVSDLLEIDADMSLDLNRNRVLDAFEDCDDNGVTDVEQLATTRAVWVADKGQAGIRRYLWIIGTETAQSVGVALQEPQDVIVTPDGRVLVSSKLDDRVAQYGPDGVSLADLVPTGAGGLSKPAGMAVSPDGDLLVASSASGAILRYDIDDGTPLAPLVADGVPLPFGLHIGPDELLYVSCGDERVERYNLTDGSLVDVFVTAGDGGLTDPRGLAFLRSGELIVASRATDQVLRYDGATGAFIGQFNRNGTPTRLTLDEPWGVRVGPDGDVYVSRANDGGADDPTGPGTGLHLTNARIYHFDGENGNFLRAYVQGTDSNLLNPTGFAFTPDGGVDCNANLIPDACDIADGRSNDLNANATPDECERPACMLDIDEDGEVNINDLLIYLDWWFAMSELAEVSGDAPPDITILDLLVYLEAWLVESAAGLCP